MAEEKGKKRPYVGENLLPSLSFVPVVIEFFDSPKSCVSR